MTDKVGARRRLTSGSFFVAIITLIMTIVIKITKIGVRTIKTLRNVRFGFGPTLIPPLSIGNLSNLPYIKLRATARLNRP